MFPPDHFTKCWLAQGPNGTGEHKNGYYYFYSGSCTVEALYINSEDASRATGVHKQTVARLNNENSKTVRSQNWQKAEADVCSGKQTMVM